MGGHSLFLVSSAVKSRHGALLPPAPGMPASSHGSGVPVLKSSHRLSINTPYPSNCICAALFTAALTPLVGTAGGFGLAPRHSAAHSASARGFAPDAHNATANAARASQN